MLGKIKLEAVPEYQRLQCELFSRFSFSSSLDEYNRRGQHDKDKIINDIYNGKIAEFMVYNFFVKKGRSLSSPDLNIYSKKMKSFDADLVIGDVSIHVKSHMSNNIFPVSWMFQKNDPLPAEDYLCLVVDNSYMYIKRVSEVEFSEPMKKSLRHTKVCLYEKNIKTL